MECLPNLKQQGKVALGRVLTMDFLLKEEGQNTELKGTRGRSPLISASSSFSGRPQKVHNVTTITATGEVEKSTTDDEMRRALLKWQSESCSCRRRRHRRRSRFYARI